MWKKQIIELGLCSVVCRLAVVGNVVSNKKARLVQPIAVDEIKQTVEGVLFLKNTSLFS